MVWGVSLCFISLFNLSIKITQPTIWRRFKKTNSWVKTPVKKLMLNLGQKREWTWLKLFMALMISKSLSWYTMGSKSFWNCNYTSGTFRSEQGCRALVTRTSNHTAYDFDLLFVFVETLEDDKCVPPCLRFQWRLFAGSSFCSSSHGLAILSRFSCWKPIKKRLQWLERLGLTELYFSS